MVFEADGFDNVRIMDGRIMMWSYETLSEASH